MHDDALIFSFSLIFSSAAVLATMALFTRQPLILAYIVVGIALGPSAAELITDRALIQTVSEFGIIFLLFLLGLDMQPSKLIASLRRSILVGVGSSLAFALIGAAIAFGFGFTPVECLVIGLAMMFSSTIIGIKLLPTTVLHHRHTGELLVSLLLIQDLLAIIVLLVLGGGLLEGGESGGSLQLLTVFAALPAIIGASLLFVRWLLLPALARFDAFHEFIFLAAIGWCFGVAEVANLAGLSREIGAFIAGVSIATSPIAYYIASHLKPLRDFFLVLFFFSLGAGFDLALLSEVALAAAVLAGVMMVAKPVVFRVLLHGVSESAPLGWELGFRLGQISEFSLLIALMAGPVSHHGTGLIGDAASHLIQATAIITFVLSTYIVVARYPTPIAADERLRRD